MDDFFFESKDENVEDTEIIYNLTKFMLEEEKLEHGFYFVELPKICDTEEEDK